jgi:hypothetical protein
VAAQKPGVAKYTGFAISKIPPRRPKIGAEKSKDKACKKINIPGTIEQLLNQFDSLVGRRKSRQK